VNAWVLVLLAGLCEVGWALGLKYSDGFTRLWPSVATVALALISFWLMSIAMKTLPVGTAYAVWVGFGAAGTALLGIVLFGEAATVLRIGGVVLILAGIAALKAA